MSRAEPRQRGADLTAGSVRARGIAAGLSAVKVARYEARWHFADAEEDAVGDRIIVAAVEQDYERMQRAPDEQYQLTVRRTLTRLLEGAIEVAGALHAAGYRAKIYASEGGAMTIPYAVSAGLGQLGMNGQLLTPQAGSRARMLLISTDAPLSFDQPVDFGIPGVCDRCRICAQRCPAGAIAVRPREHRGVEKWKIKTERCLPMVAQANGCSVCIKTCPIQRYGLERVLATYRQSGQILPQHATDVGDLETYEWPLDGRTYAAGSRPKLDAEVREPAGLLAARRAEGR
ncbi:MAG: 4Fe-4S dicluster domain-containing protein [Actinobacteria bacterium]|nr:4Fe-4S dicluster domain-containing protein [Actinomycetota bacterium]